MGQLNELQKARKVFLQKVRRAEKRGYVYTDKKSALFKGENKLATPDDYRKLTRDFYDYTVRESFENPKEIVIGTTARQQEKHLTKEQREQIKAVRTEPYKPKYQDHGEEYGVTPSLETAEDDDENAQEIIDNFIKNVYVEGGSNTTGIADILNAVNDAIAMYGKDEVAYNIDKCYTDIMSEVQGFFKYDDVIDKLENDDDRIDKIHNITDTHLETIIRVLNGATVDERIAKMY